MPFFQVRESNGRYAFILEATANEYRNNRYPCDTVKVGQNLNSIGFGVATAFGSSLKYVVQKGFALSLSFLLVERK